MRALCEAAVRPTSPPATSWRPRRGTRCASESRAGAKACAFRQRLGRQSTTLLGRGRPASRTHRLVARPRDRLCAAGRRDPEVLCAVVRARAMRHRLGALVATLPDDVSPVLLGARLRPSPQDEWLAPTLSPCFGMSSPREHDLRVRLDPGLGEDRLVPCPATCGGERPEHRKAAEARVVSTARASFASSAKRRLHLVQRHAGGAVTIALHLCGGFVRSLIRGPRLLELGHAGPRGSRGA